VVKMKHKTKDKCKECTNHYGIGYSHYILCKRLLQCNKILIFNTCFSRANGFCRNFQPYFATGNIIWKYHFCKSLELNSLLPPGPKNWWSRGGEEGRNKWCWILHPLKGAVCGTRAIVILNRSNKGTGLIKDFSSMFT
jgi:hypothetical protein